MALTRIPNRVGSLWTKRPWMFALAAALVGVGLGIFLRTALVKDTAWCRDIDYGSLPQWLALVAAIIAGIIAAMSLRVSRKAQATSQLVFDEDALLREFAQARLVYGEIAETKQISEGVSASVHFKTDSAELLQFTEDDEVAVFPGSRGAKSIFLQANVDAQVWVLRVNNDSDELISQVSVGMKDYGGQIGGPIGGNFLGPKASAEWIVAIPQERDFLPKFITVTFVDAMGRMWIRRGAQPVEPFPPEPKSPPSKFQDPAKS